MKKTRGFSLLELITVLVIIGIISAIALPLYSDVLIRSKRLEAESALLKLAAALENYYTTYNTYENATPALLQQPEIIAKGNYQLRITVASATQFSVAAQPLLEQAKKDVSCGELTLDSLGTKGIKGSGNVLQCW